MDNLPFFLFIGVLILGVLGTLERIFDFKLSRKIRGILLVFFILSSVGQYFFSNFSLRTLENEVEDIRDYGEVATWDFFGSTSLSAASGIGFDTPMSGWAEGYLTRNKDGNYDIRCDSEALNHYRQMHIKNPYYPFPLHPLVLCLKRKGDDAWRDYAKKAISILEKTTLVAGHNQGHELTLLQFKKLLNLTNGKKEQLKENLSVINPRLGRIKQR